MMRATRPVLTLVAVAAAGVLLWLATHFERGQNHGYWPAYGLIAAAGLIVGIAQVRGRLGNPRLMFGLVFLPVLVTAGWVLVAMQPEPNWFRAHDLAWSGDIGIRGLVLQLGTWLGVLAFGIGYTFGLVLEPAPAAIVEEPAYDRDAADEPVTAERRETVIEDERAREAEPVR